MIGKPLHMLALALIAVPAPIRAETPPQLGEAARLSLAGEKARALAVLGSLPQGVGDPAEIMMWQAELHLDLLEIEPAVELCKRRLAEAPDDRRALAILSEALLLRGQVRDAARAYKVYLAAVGTDPPAEAALRALTEDADAIRDAAREYAQLGRIIVGVTAAWLLALALALRWLHRAGR